MKKKYSLTEEHRAQLGPWAKQWIDIAMSTKQMSSDEKIDCANNLRNLYKAANLEVPKSIHFVASPFAAIICGGFAAAIDNLGDKSKYTIAEMIDIVVKSISDKNINDSKWYVTGYDVKQLNKQLELGDFGIECVKNAHRMYSGGNQLASWASYISFFRHIAKLDIDYSKWQYYEDFCKLNGPCILHKNFAIVSDRPEILTVNASNQPHAVNGPFCQWRDGAAMYAVNGVRVPAWIIRRPQDLSVDIIEKETNAEIRRVMVDIYGKDKYIIDSKVEAIHSDDFGTLYVKEQEGDEPLMMVKVINSTQEPDGTFKEYWLRVDEKMYGGIKTARAAVASTWRNKDGSLVFKKPEDYDPSIET